MKFLTPLTLAFLVTVSPVLSASFFKSLGRDLDEHLSDFKNFFSSDSTKSKQLKKPEEPANSSAASRPPPPELPPFDKKGSHQKFGKRNGAGQGENTSALSFPMVKERKRRRAVQHSSSLYGQPVPEIYSHFPLSGRTIAAEVAFGSQDKASSNQRKLPLGVRKGTMKYKNVEKFANAKNGWLFAE